MRGIFGVYLAALRSLSDGQAAECLLDSSGRLLTATSLDQTTDGTTNRTVPPFSRSKRIDVTAASVQASGYAQSKSMGLITLSLGLGASAQVRLKRLEVDIFATSFSAAGGWVPYLFEANPTASTFTDGSTAVLDAADQDKICLITGAVAPIAIDIGTVLHGNTQDSTNVEEAALTTDSGGNLYLALIASATITSTSATKLRVRADFRY